MTSDSIFSRCSITCALTGFAFLGAATASAQRRGPPGGPSRGDQRIVKKYDKDGDGRLNADERSVARKDLEENARPRRRRRRRSRREPGKPGPKVAVEDAKIFPDAKLYDPSVLRTMFFEFESEDWEKELAIFKPTDVEVSAKLTVDGKTYPGVGVSFRGASSFFMIPEGLKRSLNVSIDFVDPEQRLYGYRTLNLLNGSGDASMMSSIVYSHLARRRIPASKVNYVHVVINGRSWGIYISSQQFNRTFIKEHYEKGKGARWKVPGSPRGDGGLRYTGEEVEEYRRRFEIKSADKPESWRDLIQLCKVLNETPQGELEKALEPILNIDGVLWFLAVDLATVNSDGYWTRASDYSIYQDPNGKFHILPHDMNEAFRGRSYRGRGGVELDPLIGLESERMPLRSVLLSVPKWQRQYLENLREIAHMLRWEKLGPRVQKHRELIRDAVERDTRKLYTMDQILEAIGDTQDPATGLRSFCEKRSAYLLSHPKIQALDK